MNREVYEIQKKMGADLTKLSEKTMAEVMSNYQEKTQMSNKQMTEVMVHALEKHQLALESHMAEVLEY